MDMYKFTRKHKIVSLSNFDKLLISYFINKNKRVVFYIASKDLEHSYECKKSPVRSPAEIIFFVINLFSFSVY